MIGAFIAVAVGLGAYWAAEQKGRSPSLWLMLAAGAVFASYTIAYLATQSLASSNVIFTDAGGAVALAMIGAGPTAGIATGIAMIAWLMRAPASASLSSAIPMYGGFQHEEAAMVSVRVRGRVLVLDTGDIERRIEADRIQRTAVDGEYLVVHVEDEPTALTLRPTGDAYQDRERCVALVQLMAKRLRKRE
jgi:hypothetical protein